MTITCPQVAGQQIGDVLFASVSIPGPNQDLIAKDAGWATVANIGSAQEWTGSNTLGVFERVVGPSDPPSYTFSWRYWALNSKVVLVDLSGAGSVLDASAALATDIYNTPVDLLPVPPSFEAPAVTTTLADDLLLVFAGSAEYEFFTPPPELSAVSNEVSFASDAVFSALPGVGAVGPFSITASTNADFKAVTVAVPGQVP
jgi:hypothetical protein